MVLHHTSCRDFLEILEFRSPWRLRKPRSEGQIHLNILPRRFAAEIGVSRVTKSWPCHMEPNFQRLLKTILTFQTYKTPIFSPFSHRFSIDFPMKNFPSPKKIPLRRVQDELDGSFGVWSHGLRNCQRCAEGLVLSVTMPSPMQLWNQEVSSRSVRWYWIILNTYFIFFHHTFHFSVQMEINVHFFQKMIYKWRAFHISMWFFACNRIWSNQSVGIGRQKFGQFLNNQDMP